MDLALEDQKEFSRFVARIQTDSGNAAGKQYRIKFANDALFQSVLSEKAFNNPSDSIKDNAELHFDITKMIAKMDAVKYLKFASHKVMLDRTSLRLGREIDRTDLENTMERLVNTLVNISDAESVKQGDYVNIVLILISVISLFQIIFSENSIPIIELFFGESSSMAIANSVIEVARVIFILGLCLLAYLLRKIVAGNNHIKKRKRKNGRNRNQTL